MKESVYMYLLHNGTVTAYVGVIDSLDKQDLASFYVEGHCTKHFTVSSSPGTIYYHTIWYHEPNKIQAIVEFMNRTRAIMEKHKSEYLRQKEVWYSLREERLIAMRGWD